jgi:hypothetical protein
VPLAAGDGQTGDEWGLVQSTRHQQPTMVGDDPHLPALAGQAQHDFGDFLQQIAGLRREIGTEGVPTNRPISPHSGSSLSKLSVVDQPAASTAFSNTGFCTGFP